MDLPRGRVPSLATGPALMLGRDALLCSHGPFVCRPVASPKRFDLCWTFSNCPLGLLPRTGDARIAECAGTRSRDTLETTDSISSGGPAYLVPVLRLLHSPCTNVAVRFTGHDTLTYLEILLLFGLAPWPPVGLLLTLRLRPAAPHVFRPLPASTGRTDVAWVLERGPTALSIPHHPFAAVASRVHCA